MSSKKNLSLLRRHRHDGSGSAARDISGMNISFVPYHIHTGISNLRSTHSARRFTRHLYQLIELEIVSLLSPTLTHPEPL
jgi:hypothetical protein